MEEARLLCEVCQYVICPQERDMIERIAAVGGGRISGAAYAGRLAP